MAVICCACDISAARKLYDFISARIACYRCMKRANFDERNQLNFGGFADMSEWFVERNIDIIRRDANLWKNCYTDNTRKKHTSETSVQWSEIYRLPYFNSVRFIIIDPMHCLFLGIAK